MKRKSLILLLIICLLTGCSHGNDGDSPFLSAAKFIAEIDKSIEYEYSTKTTLIKSLIVEPDDEFLVNTSFTNEQISQIVLDSLFNGVDYNNLIGVEQIEAFRSIDPSEYDLNGWVEELESRQSKTSVYVEDGVLVADGTFSFDYSMLRNDFNSFFDDIEQIYYYGDGDNYYSSDFTYYITHAQGSSILFSIEAQGYSGPITILLGVNTHTDEFDYYKHTTHFNDYINNKDRSEKIEEHILSSKITDNIDFGYDIESGATYSISGLEACLKNALNEYQSLLSRTDKTPLRFNVGEEKAIFHIGDDGYLVSKIADLNGSVVSHEGVINFKCEYEEYYLYY